MSYNAVKVISVKSGAMLNDVIHDQWIELEFEDNRFVLFDQNVVFPLNLIGKEVRIEISVMPVKVEKSDCNKIGFNDERNFVGILIKKDRTCDTTNYVLDVDGLKVILNWEDEFNLEACLKIEGRLDIEKIEGINETGWKTIQK